MDSVISSISLDVLAILIPALVGWLIAFVNKKIGTENAKKIDIQIATKKGIAWDAVNFVEQAYKDLDGAGKFAKAEAWLIAEAKAVGITLTVDTIKGLIESSVKVMKDSIAK
jgi:hypothetical protein